MKRMNMSKRPVSHREAQVLQGRAQGIWGLRCAGHTVTSTVFSPANPNPAGEGRGTRVFNGGYEL